jgi:hypothetical protein
MDQDPEYEIIAKGRREEDGFKRAIRLGKCACGAHVCVRCHQQIQPDEHGAYVHTCRQSLDREMQTDPATQALLKVRPYNSDAAK